MKFGSVKGVRSVRLGRNYAIKSVKESPSSSLLYPFNVIIWCLPATFLLYNERRTIDERMIKPRVKRPEQYVIYA